MALPSFLKRKVSPAAQPQPAADGVDVQQARKRARRRLLGAAVLLALGVITFPLLFETQPRPIPLDIPIEIARKDAASDAPASARPARLPTAPPVPIDPNPNPIANVVEEPPAVPASAPLALPAAGARTVTPGPAPSPPLSVKPAATPASVPVQAGPPREPPKERPKEPPVAKAEAGASAAEPRAGRFVVQVGAFADATVAREVRLKVERLGLKTYTQVVDTEGGKRTRVRIGPFESRDDAAKVLAKLKSVDLPGAVLAL